MERFAPLTAVLFVLLAATASAFAQPAKEKPDRPSSPWFPREALFEPPLASPLETGFRGSLLVASGRGFYEGTHVEAEVVLGEHIPLLRLRRETFGGPGISVNFETGILTRFYIDMPSDLINADFRVGVPVELRYREWSARLELRHISAHLGDDFGSRFDAPFQNLSYEGTVLLMARRLGPFRLYGGGAYNYRRQGAEQASGQGGMEYDGRRQHPEALVAFLAAAHGRTTTAAAGTSLATTAITATAGISIQAFERLFHLEVRAHTGPTPLGQLRGYDEQFVGLGLRLD